MEETMGIQKAVISLFVGLAGVLATIGIDIGFDAVEIERIVQTFFALLTAFGVYQVSNSPPSGGST